MSCRWAHMNGLNRTGRGEFLGWQALFHAVAGEPRSARERWRPTLAVRVAALRSQQFGFSPKRSLPWRSGTRTQRTARLSVVIETGIWDPVVIAVRAAPALGEFMAEQPEWRSWLQRVLSASSDTSLASRLGLRVPRAAKPAARLTPRESEVHELLAQGLTNEEIARQLYISLSTTKVHVKHIYEKLGVRSRLEAARALRDDV